jgi:hypothetical protein
MIMRPSSLYLIQEEPLKLGLDGVDEGATQQGWRHWQVVLNLAQNEHPACYAELVNFGVRQRERSGGELGGQRRPGEVGKDLVLSKARKRSGEELGRRGSRRTPSAGWRRGGARRGRGRRLCVSGSEVLQYLFPLSLHRFRSDQRRR